MNFAKFLRTPIFIVHLWWLLLENVFEVALLLNPSLLSLKLLIKTTSKKTKEIFLLRKQTQHTFTCSK